MQARHTGRDALYARHLALRARDFETARALAPPDRFWCLWNTRKPLSIASKRIFTTRRDA
jgi:hypothetical protein